MSVNQRAERLVCGAKVFEGPAVANECIGGGKRHLEGEGESSGDAAVAADDDYDGGDCDCVLTMRVNAASKTSLKKMKSTCTCLNVKLMFMAAAALFCSATANRRHCLHSSPPLFRPHTPAVRLPVKSRA
jgi:hypothetical protein